MIEAGAPSTEGGGGLPPAPSPLGGGSHGLTTGDSTQRIKGAKLKAAPDRSKGAAKGIIKAEIS
jgi:hypothetical protein